MENKAIEELKDFGFEEVSVVSWVYDKCPFPVVVFLSDNVLDIRMNGNVYLSSYLLDKDESILNLLLCKILDIGSWIKQPKTLS